MLPLAVGIWGGQSPPRRTIEALLYGPARALRADAGTLSGHAIGEQPDRVPVVDLLGDVGAVYVRAERADRPTAPACGLRTCARCSPSSDVLAAALKPLGTATEGPSKSTHTSAAWEAPNPTSMNGKLGTQDTWSIAPPSPREHAEKAGS